MEPKVKDIMAILEKHYPLYLAEEWDNCGLQIGDREQRVAKLAVSLDPSPDVIKMAAAERADLLVTHHPLLFSPLKSIDYRTPTGSLIKILADSNISLYSAHTNLDSAPRGLNQHLAELIGLKDIEPLSSGRRDSLYKLTVYVPESHLEVVREVLGQAGAGHIGLYSDCSFSVAGQGAFRPLPGSDPYIGTTGQLENVAEYRLETIVYQSSIPETVQKMLAVHPYQEAAYDLYLLANQGRLISPGRKGSLPETINLKDLAGRIKEVLQLSSIKVLGSLEKPMQRVAVVSGSGASFIKTIAADGLDVLITGDVKYHEACLARDLGLCLIDAGHHGSEQIMVGLLSSMLEQECQARDFGCQVVHLYEPDCLKNY